MPHLRYSAITELPPDRVLAVATDFSAARLKLWPTIDPAVYKVHGAGDGWADVTEGSRTLGGIWAHERYEWSGNTVTAHVQESNIFSEGVWRLTANSRPGGGTVVEIDYNRHPHGLRGHIISTVLRLSHGKPLINGLKETLEIAAGSEPNERK